MSKVVDWGHWAAGTFFLILALDVLVSSVAEIPGLLRKHPQEVTYYVAAHALFIWLPALFCAWGVLKWRSWARNLGIVLCALFGALGFAFAFYSSSGIRVSWALLLMALASCSVFAWLLLPSVRAEYSRRNQLA